MPKSTSSQIENIALIGSVERILEVICRISNMGFAAIAEITGERWVACKVRDEAGLGIAVGDELNMNATFCQDVRTSGKGVAIDDTERDAVYCTSPLPAQFGFRSYISIPIVLADGSFFGTLCAIDRNPAKVNTPEIISMFTLFAELIAFHLDAQNNFVKSAAHLATSAASLATSEAHLATSEAHLAKSEANLASSRATGAADRVTSAANLASSEANLAFSEASLASSAVNLADANQNSQLREQFVAVLGHDLRNPLASISAGTRLLTKSASDAKALSILVSMQKSVVRMASLIDNVVDFARGRLGGGLGLSIAKAEALEPTLLHVIGELQSGSPDRLFDVHIANLEPVNCDSGRIGQMLSNLLGNAISHGSSDSPIVVRVTTARDMLEISVANGGEPISDAVMARIFQPFFRGEVRKSLQGLGLGLFIASEIAKAHNATLAVCSSANETKFTFQMPLH
jgi:signal transduction histidine kinase